MLTMNDSCHHHIQTSNTTCTVQSFDKGVTYDTSLINTKTFPLSLLTSVFTWQQSSLLLQCCVCVMLSDNGGGPATY
jgi:hypothetical protein